MKFHVILIYIIRIIIFAFCNSPVREPENWGAPLEELWSGGRYLLDVARPKAPFWSWPAPAEPKAPLDPKEP